MRIENDRFMLRKWELGDIPSLAKHANNENIARNLRDRFPHPYTEEDAVEFLNMVLAKPQPLTNFAIEIDGQAVGGVGIVPQQDVERISAEIGYWLGEEYWGRGIMTEVVRLTVEYTFEHFEIVKIFAPVFEFNDASKRVLVKAGFELEGVLKQAAIKNDRIIDLHYYGKKTEPPLLWLPAASRCKTAQNRKF